MIDNRSVLSQAMWYVEELNFQQAKGNFMNANNILSHDFRSCYRIVFFLLIYFALIFDRFDTFCYSQVTSVMSDSVRPHRRQPTRLCRPWDSPGKNTGVGCHFLLQCVKVKIESEVTQSCLTLSNIMDRGLPGSSIHGIFQARVGCHFLLWALIHK